MMSRIALLTRRAPALAGLMFLGGCATYAYDGDWESGYPVGSGYVYDDDYRYYNPDGLIVRYDSGPSLYAVVSYPNLYWNDGYYYRPHGSYWERSRHYRGPWVAHRHEPPRVRYRHDPPPGRALRVHSDNSDRRAVRGPETPAYRERYRRPLPDTGLNVYRPAPPVRNREQESDSWQRRLERARVPNGVPMNGEPPRFGQPPRSAGSDPRWNRGRPNEVQPRPDPGARPPPPVIERTPRAAHPGMDARLRERIEQARNRPQPGGAPATVRQYPLEGRRAPANRQSAPRPAADPEAAPSERRWQTERQDGARSGDPRAAPPRSQNLQARLREIQGQYR
jgi:hypothetical protein